MTNFFAKYLQTIVVSPVDPAFEALAACLSKHLHKWPAPLHHQIGCALRTCHEVAAANCLYPNNQVSDLVLDDQRLAHLISSATPAGSLVVGIGLHSDVCNNLSKGQILRRSTNKALPHYWRGLPISEIRDIRTNSVHVSYRKPSGERYEPYGFTDKTYYKVVPYRHDILSVLNVKPKPLDESLPPIPLVYAQSANICRVWTLRHSIERHVISKAFETLVFVLSTAFSSSRTWVLPLPPKGLL